MTQSKIPKKRQRIDGKTVGELANQFEVATATMRNIAMQLKPVGKRGRSMLYDPKAVAAILSNQAERKQKPPELKDLEKKKIELQCRKLEIEIERTMRTLVPVDEVRGHLQRMIDQVRRHLLTMPAICAPLVVGHDDRDAERILREHHLEMLATLQGMEFEE